MEEKKADKIEVNIPLWCKLLYGNKKKIGKALAGHLKGATYRHLKEFPLMEGETRAVGDAIDVSVFSPGETVSIQGISKGKGFQGVVKRHGFHGFLPPPETSLRSFVCAVLCRAFDCMARTTCCNRRSFRFALNTASGSAMFPTSLPS